MTGGTGNRTFGSTCVVFFFTLLFPVLTLLFACGAFWLENAPM